MNKYTNTAKLELRAAALLVAVGRVYENELWPSVDSDANRVYIDKDIEKAIRDIADWAGFDLVKREAKQEVS
jgi:hypothetical protein